MKKLFEILIFSSFLFGTNAFAEKQEESKSKRIVVLELIEEEMKTIKRNTYSSSNLEHRYFELLCEKTKILREIETAEYLKNIDQKNAQLTLNNKKSKESFNLAQKYGLEVIKNYPKYEKINDIYYSLAINSREFGFNNESEYFLKKAIEKSKKDERTYYFSKVALAENYYNSKKYDEAITLFEEIIKNTHDEWHSKHLLNASWCHLKNRNSPKALELLLDAYKASENKKYISLLEQVLNALPIFFVQANQTERGISFFEKKFSDPTPYLMNLALSSQSKNIFIQTQDVILAALKSSQKSKKVESEIKVRLLQLDIYREAKKDELFFEAASGIVNLILKNKVQEDLVENAIRKIKEVTGFMQINLVKQKNKNSITYDLESYKKILKYFDFLSKIDPNNAPIYSYYQGETSLSIEKRKKAINYYSRSIIIAKKITPKPKDVLEKSIIAMLSILDDAKLTPKEYDAFVIFSIKNYLLLAPQSIESKKYYQKLFNTYFKNKEIKKSINTLLVYNLNHPQDNKIHQEMLSLVLEEFIKKKESTKLAFWVMKIEAGFLKFSPDYIQKSIEILGGILFEKYQKLEQAGLVEQAQKGYVSIFENKKYPLKIKAEAAYSLSTLSLFKNQVKNSRDWLQKSLELSKREEILKLLPSLVEIAKSFRLLQRFDYSSELAKQILQITCAEKHPKKEEMVQIYFQNEIINAANAKNIFDLEKELKNCNLEQQVFLENEKLVIEHFTNTHNLTELLAFLNQRDLSDESRLKITHSIRSLFWQKDPFDSRTISYLEKLDENYPQLKIFPLVEEIKELLVIKNETENFEIALTSKEVFDEDLFNSEIEQYFSLAATLLDKANNQKKKSGPETAITLQELSKVPFYKLISALMVFQPRGVDSQYLESYSKAKRQIIESLNAKILQIESEKKAFLKKNQFFLPEHYRAKFSQAEERVLFNKHFSEIYMSTLDSIKGI